MNFDEWWGSNLLHNFDAKSAAKHVWASAEKAGREQCRLICAEEAEYEEGRGAAACLMRIENLDK